MTHYGNLKENSQESLRQHQSYLSHHSSMT
nr:MAG TPA: hypothetical protein [Caudoviricetes sp.]